MSFPDPPSSAGSSPRRLGTLTLRGIAWSAAERYSAQAVAFVVLLIMARLLTPLDYGVVGLLLIFVDIAQCLTDAGFSQALIRKQNITDADKATAFWYNLTASLIIYMIIWFAAPFITLYFNRDVPALLTRVLSLTIVINALTIVQRASLTAKVDFKTQAKASLLAALIAGGTGIGAALAGAGVWALVAYQLTQSACQCVILRAAAGHLPLQRPEASLFHGLFGFGWRLALAGLLDTLWRNLSTWVIGRAFSPVSVGYYSRARQFSAFLSSNPTLIMQRVFYPALCTIANDDARLRKAYRKCLMSSSAPVFVMLALLAATAAPLVEWLLTDKWLPAAALIPPLCLSMMWYPLNSLNLNIIAAKGDSRLYLRLELLKKVVSVSVLFAALPHGLDALVWSLALSALICMIINAVPMRRSIGVSVWHQVFWMLPGLMAATALYGLTLLGSVP